MTNRQFFLRTIYAVGGIQLASIFLAWYGQHGLMMADSIVLFLADWTAFTLMAHRHARLSPLTPSRLSQGVGLVCLALGIVRLFTVGSSDSVALILGAGVGWAWFRRRKSVSSQS